MAETEGKKCNEWPLRSIYFYLTPECNLACRHCWIAPRMSKVRVANEYLPFSLLTSIIQQALPLGLTSMKLTGGEPLLHPDILEIIEVGREQDLELVVETNGTLITPAFARSLAECDKRFISVSLDGADARTHEWVRGVPGSYEDACAGLRLLVDTGLKPQIIMSLFRRNVHQVEPLVRMAEDLGAGSVKFNIIQPTARGLQVHKDGEALSVPELIELNHWIESDLSKDTKMKLHFCIPAAFRPLGSLFGPEGSGCARCQIQNILGVLGDGSYALCGIGEVIPDMIFGQAQRDPLTTVWDTHPVLMDIREGLPGKLTGICGRCTMKGVCLGSCLAQNYSGKQDIWAPFWFCEEAEFQGLFPPTRSLKNE